MLPLARDFAPVGDSVLIVKRRDASTELPWCLDIEPLLPLSNSLAHRDERLCQRLPIVVALQSGHFAVGRHQLVDIVVGVSVAVDCLKNIILDKLVKVLASGFGAYISFVSNP